MSLGAVWAGVGWLTGRLVGGPPSCSCECVFRSEGPDAGVLELLRSQLDRCGPERLAGSPLPAAPLPRLSPLLDGVAVVAAFFLGVLATLTWQSCSGAGVRAELPLSAGVVEADAAEVTGAQPRRPRTLGRAPGVTKGQVLNA